MEIVKHMMFFTGSYSNGVFPEPLTTEEEELYVNRKKIRMKNMNHGVTSIICHKVLYTL